VRHQGLYKRLVALTHEPENDSGCWTWLGLVKARYPRCNIRNDENKHTEIRPHRAMLVLMECDGEWEHFWQLYLLYSLAELQADHLCFNELCINPDHLRWLTPEENRARRWAP
jgi:hypothetical protein